MLKAEGQSEWIKNKKYRDSIINVIGKAIGDCMACENEFDCAYLSYNRERLGDRTITFARKKYKDPCFYTISNWNAVFLYNAVNLAINNKKYWNDRVFNADNLIQECYNRIKTFYSKYFDKPLSTSLNITCKMPNLKEKFTSLEKIKEQITNNLTHLHEDVNNNRFIKNKRKEDSVIINRELKNIEELQEALKNFDKNQADDMESTYNNAINKLEQVHHTQKLRVGSVYYEYQILSDDKYKQIFGYLKEMHLTRALAALPRTLEKAKSDMIKYFKALNLDKILYYYKSCLYKNDYFTPAKLKYTKFPYMGKQYEVFIYDDILMDLEVKNTGECQDEKPIIQEIGYSPDFFVKGGYICISDVSKIKWTHSESLFYLDKKEELENFKWTQEDKYADLLELLQDLVVPMKND